MSTNEMRVRAEVNKMFIRSVLNKTKVQGYMVFIRYNEHKRNIGPYSLEVAREVAAEYKEMLCDVDIIDSETGEVVE